MPADQDPETIGPYKVQKALGKGSVGAVYLVEQTALKRLLAVKVLYSEGTKDAEFVERFRREGQIAARLRHPNIVHVHDFGEANGQYYISMEYVGPRNLKDVIHSYGGKVPLGPALKYTDELLSALEHAHSLGIVHRDIKPANVLISDHDQATLTDFSIAQMADSGARMTQTGVMMGTPEYMSPEQFDAKNVDGRTDLYATGLMLYEMLMGEHPFAVGSVSLVLKAQLFKTPTAPHVGDPSIPEMVSRVIMKSMEKVANDRYATAGEMRKALSLAASGVELPAPLQPAAPVQAPLISLPPTVSVGSAPPRVSLNAEDPDETLPAIPAKVGLKDDPDPRSESGALPPAVAVVKLTDSPPPAPVKEAETGVDLALPSPPRPTQDTLIHRTPEPAPPSHGGAKIAVGVVAAAACLGLAWHFAAGSGPTPSPSPIAIAEPVTPTPEVGRPSGSATPVTPTSATPTPPPAADGHLAIQLSPSPKEATISLDGKPGIKPGVGLDIPPGEHTVVVKADGYDEKTEKFVVDSGKTLNLPVNLVKAQYSFTVNVTTPGSKVLWDKEPVDPKAAKSTKGKHQLKVTKPGFQDYDKQVELTKADQAFSVALTPVPPPVVHHDPPVVHRDPPPIRTQRPNPPPVHTGGTGSSYKL